MRRVYIAESLIDAQLVSDLLVENHIQCNIFNQNSMSGFGELPASYPEIWVGDTQVEYARSLIDRYVNEMQSDESVICIHCKESNPTTFGICWQCHKPITDNTESGR